MYEYRWQLTPKSIIVSHRMAHILPHNLKNLCHSQITTAHRHLSIYVRIVFIKILCRQRFVSFLSVLNLTQNVVNRMAHHQLDL